MSRTLGLPADCLTAPGTAHVVIVASRMLWPGDDDLRHRALGAAWCEQVLLSGQLPAPRGRAELDFVRSAPKPSDFAEEIKAGYRAGIIAGQILLHALDGMSLTAAKQRIASNLRNDRISVETINHTIWRAYRCVSPYWAAYIKAGGFDTTSAPWLPCWPADLGLFLARADAIRERGEAVSPFRSPRGPVLRAGLTITLDPEIRAILLARPA